VRPGRKLLVLDESNGLRTGQSRQYSIEVTDPAQPLKVTLAWTDPAGAESAAKALVNNLDLELSDGTTTYLPMLSNGSTGVDSTNNVLGIDIAAPAAGHGTPVGHEWHLAAGLR
jgi:hypothetical protein